MAFGGADGRTDGGDPQNHVISCRLAMSPNAYDIFSIPDFPKV